MKSLFFLVVSMMFLLSLAGCEAENATTGVLPASVSTPPLLGQADSADGADHACQVVLRQVNRDWAPEQDAFETWCADGACTYVWRGTVEVAEPAAGDVYVLYRLAPGTTWYELPTLQVPSRTPGFRTYAFVISEHVFGPELAPEDQPAIELVAFLQGAGAGRLFDHNVHAGDLDNTLLDANNGFMDSAGSGVCQPELGVISFDAYWGISTYNSRRQGGFLRVDYALDRLPDCRDTHNGYPAWDIIAHARFLPGQQEVSASLRQPSEYFSANDTSASFVFRIPQDARSVELWFENASGAGSTCRTWDSNYGNNYVFDVWPAADSLRCLDVERDGQSIINGDARNIRNQPYCIGYDLAAQYDATNCEFHTSSLGVAYEGHYGMPLRWIFAWINVGAVAGEVLSAGLFTRYRDELTGEDGERYSLGYQTEPGRWRVGFTYEMVIPAVRVQILELAFFLDVSRADGTVVRLWQSRQGQNYPFDDVMNHLGATESIPYGNIRMATQDALIFDARNTCAR